MLKKTIFQPFILSIENVPNRFRSSVILVKSVWLLSTHKATDGMCNLSTPQIRPQLVLGSAHTHTAKSMADRGFRRPSVYVRRLQSGCRAL
jgi:hypothetical protein